MSDTVPAMCPHCGGHGCDYCFEGQTVFSMPDVNQCQVYTRKCNNCGFENGMLFVGENYFPPEKFEKRKPGSCINCHSEDVDWLEI